MHEGKLADADAQKVNYRTQCISIKCPSLCAKQHLSTSYSKGMTEGSDGCA